ncbi:MAG: lysoplasmalogenase [Oligoflexia bacterium]|nr:lysoplasmalogenase [Oligoflexia bacterium]
MRHALVAIAALAMIAFFVASGLEEHHLALVVKPLPVLALALFQRQAAPGTRPGLVALGLVLSGVGDLLLELHHGLFLLGLLSFLLAHLAYSLAFLLRAPGIALRRGLVMMAYGVAAFLVLRPGLGDMAIPVAAYVSVICTMGWRALAMFGQVPWAAASLAVGGALSFILSDTILATNRFVLPLVSAPWLVMATYWAGQIGIALSTQRAASSEATVSPQSPTCPTAP